MERFVKLRSKPKSRLATIRTKTYYLLLFFLYILDLKICHAQIQKKLRILKFKKKKCIFSIKNLTCYQNSVSRILYYSLVFPNFVHINIFFTTIRRRTTFSFYRSIFFCCIEKVEYLHLLRLTAKCFVQRLLSALHTSSLRAAQSY